MCFLVITMLHSRPSASETGNYNIHLEAGPAFALAGWQAEELGVGIWGAARFEWALFERLGLEAGGGYLGFFTGSHPRGFEPLDGAYLIAGSLGARVRLLNDEEGYLLTTGAGRDHIGNWWGNLWLDAHGDYFYTGGEHRFGADVGIGAELSLLNGFQVGPFARGMYIYQPDSVNQRDSDDGWILLAGLTVSIAIPLEGKRIPDSDNDGILDPDDQCVSIPEDRDEFEDDDGCPDEDNDKDGVPDTGDKCPLEPEDPDGFEDDDGCPDEDNDKDGVPDSVDQCDGEREDKDNFQDDDGCIDADNDGDGLLDGDDDCPDEPELVNDVNDHDGCPEGDKDRDGFIDELDSCPSEPETVNGVKDDDGCPDKALVEVQANKILGGERIFFDTGYARVKRLSREFLKELAQLIKSHPEFVLISIKGHTDDVGDPEFNYKLSVRRARRVKQYLVRLKVDRDRLVVEGFGETAPWKTGDSDQDRQKNRRVEITITKVDEALATTPIAPETQEAINTPADPSPYSTAPSSKPEAKVPSKKPSPPLKLKEENPYSASEPEKEETTTPKPPAKKAPDKKPDKSADQKTDKPAKTPLKLKEDNPYSTDEPDPPAKSKPKPKSKPAEDNPYGTSAPSKSKSKNPPPAKPKSEDNPYDAPTGSDGQSGKQSRTAPKGESTNKPAAEAHPGLAEENPYE